MKNTNTSIAAHVALILAAASAGAPVAASASSATAPVAASASSATVPIAASAATHAAAARTAASNAVTDSTGEPEPVAIHLAQSSTAAAGKPAVVHFNMPSLPLNKALNTFAEQAELRIVFDTQAAANLTAPALRGDFTATQALDRLLAGSRLTYRFTDARTVAVDGPAPTPGASNERDANRADSRLAQASNASRASDEPPATSRQPAGPPADTSSAENDTAEVRVTGSRIRRDAAETSMSPVTVFTRQDIERSGALVIADFLGRVTQATPDITRQEPTNDVASGRTTINLRGLGNNTTLVLLNGRRLPKSGQGFGSDDYNLNGIPLAFVERIEVLTNSASAIYGSDAIGGVINIITRDQYDGADLAVRYGNTFDSDVAEKSINGSLGRAGLIGGTHHYSAVLNAATNERNALAARDRPYTAKADYSASGGQPLASPGPFSPLNGAGKVLVLPPGTLPGLASFWAAIPNGQDGRHLVPADFATTGPFTPYSVDIPAYSLLLGPSRDHSVSFNGTLDLTAHAQWFASATYFERKSEFQSLPPGVNFAQVPADNPFNPFGTAVYVAKTLYELGPSGVKNEEKNAQLATGVRGALFSVSDWHYEVSGDYSRYVGKSATTQAEMMSSSAVQQALTFPTPGQELNLFGDGRTTQPNDLALLRSLIGTQDYKELSQNWTASLQLDGTVMHVPGGTLKMAVGGEYYREKVDFHKFNDTASGAITLDTGTTRERRAAFVEISSPLWVKQLELSLAGRLDAEGKFGEEITPKAGLLWHPMKWLALRATYGRGYKIPSLQQLEEPNQRVPFSFNPPLPVDPVTGEVISRQVETLIGGSPDLKPEKSKSWSAGFVLEPAWLAGMSLSVDYFNIDFTNKVTGFIPFQTLLDRFPSRVERDPITNLVTLFDARAINLSAATASGVDLRLVQQIPTDTYGLFDLQINYTYNISNKEQSVADAPAVELIDQPRYPRVRANAQAFWSYAGWQLGPTVSYESSTLNELVGGATAPVRIRHAVVVDAQCSFDFDRQGLASAWAEGVKLTAGIDNVFDRVPSPTDGDGGYAKIDPRQRRYYLQLRKHF